MFRKSKWIWISENAEKDEYVEFRETFDYHGGELKLFIAADSNFAVYVNGNLAGSQQYGDFEYWKIADEIDIGKHCTEGENILSVVVWYYGEESLSVYRPGRAGVIYELASEDGNIVLASSSSTLSRLSRAYKNHYCKNITGQMGNSFLYDASLEDDWMSGGGDGFCHSTVIEKPMPVMLRPIKKLTLEEPVAYDILKNEDNKRILIDMGDEYVGLIDVDIESDVEQTVLIAFGEHIADGCVRRLITGSDFSVEVKIPSGRTEYLNPFRRIAARYLEVFAEHPVKINRVTLRPTVYPVDVKPFDAGSKLRNDIYRICVNTLRLCMHEHYEDCPWREQALYAMDSRNQMLCGYYAFGEYDFPRASLQLMAHDTRYDDLLTITVPCGMDLCIPSFSLHYITAVLEYYIHSGDITLLEEVYGKLESILAAMWNNMRDGLYCSFAGRGHWNYYESGISGSFSGDKEPTPDLVGNCLFVIALENMEKISAWLGKSEGKYSALAAKVRERINEVFYDSESGFYFYQLADRRITELGSSLAILCGAADSERAERIAEAMACETVPMQEISLSMTCFKYDALLKVNREKYKNYVIETIEKEYKIMLDWGATTVWESRYGVNGDQGKGSLCHGWSALPVYYFHTLL